MAGLPLKAESSSVALVAATAKTVLQLNCAANQAIEIDRIGIFFDGASPTAVPVLVQVIRKTTAGTGTALPLIKMRPSDPEVAQTTATENHTAEGTNTTDIVDQWFIHPQQGLDIFPPYGKSQRIAGGGRVAIVCTAPAGVNVRAKIEFVE